MTAIIRIEFNRAERDHIPWIPFVILKKWCDGNTLRKTSYDGGRLLKPTL